MSGNVSGLGRTSGTTGTVVVRDEGIEDDDDDSCDDSVGNADDEGILGILAQCAAKTTWWKG